MKLRERVEPEERLMLRENRGCGWRALPIVTMPWEPPRLLTIPAGAPVLSAQRIRRLPDGRVMEFVESAMRGDRYEIVLELAAGRFGPPMAAGKWRAS